MCHHIIKVLPLELMSLLQPVKIFCFDQRFATSLCSINYSWELVFDISVICFSLIMFLVLSILYDIFVCLIRIHCCSIVFVENGVMRVS